MHQKLYKATTEGNTETLIKLLREDDLILDRPNITTTNFLETPLHIAVILGHERFSIELLKRKPGLACELDSRRSSPLHLASAKGHVGIVKALLEVNSDMCLACDRDGKNPLHVAAMRGRIDALKEMVRVKPDAARAIVSQLRGDQTILHLCVEYCQFEALKVLMESVDFADLVNRKDRNGNTVLHLAVADKQVQTTDFLLSLVAIEVNTPNLSGITAMDILIQRRRDVRDLEMEESFKRAGAAAVSASRETYYSPILLDHQNMEYKVPNTLQNNDFITENSINHHHKEDWLEKKRSALMIVASLIATMAFQVGVSPPGGDVWRNQNTSNSVRDPRTPSDYLTIIYDYLKEFVPFYIVNTVSFIASLSIILLLMSGLPLSRRKLFMWILMVITWIAITAIALSYTISVILLTPKSDDKMIGNIIGITVFVWICLMVILLLGHTVRLVVKMVQLMIKPFSRRKRVVVYGSLRGRNNVRV